MFVVSALLVSLSLDRNNLCNNRAKCENLDQNQVLLALLRLLLVYIHYTISSIFAAP